MEQYCINQGSKNRETTSTIFVISNQEHNLILKIAPSTARHI